MAIQWDKKFEIGHPRIDAEHRIFLNLIQEFGERLEGGATLDSLRRILTELRYYAEFHFVSEENLMEEVGYPALAEHQQLHKMLLATLKDQIRQTLSTAQPSRAFLTFLLDWFSIHTSREDRKLASYVAENGDRLAFNPFDASASG